MRLFIAINFNDNIKKKLQEIIEGLRGESKRGSFSRIENLHLTLAFLGEIEAEKVAYLKSIMDEIDAEPFQLQLSHLGVFNRKGSSEGLYWCGIKHNKILYKVQEKLAAMLKENDFNLDDKPFKPHITLARRCILPKDFSLESFNRLIVDDSMVVNEISLMKSERINEVLTYTEIYKKKI
ncbi:RNA 2',3'-cyclic phosphodiesterase [Alloiococcus sp. CFN-8]|uniref:RNA 2',3'-cyclic phosphodiesterase n=1 Tax=Alloiococcus sp. CFN-8 TaxID=3416081 RepID=UPI003CF0F556